MRDIYGGKVSSMEDGRQSPSFEVDADSPDWGARGDRRGGRERRCVDRHRGSPADGVSFSTPAPEIVMPWQLPEPNPPVA
jgi:hypothetical protein